MAGCSLAFAGCCSTKRPKEAPSHAAPVVITAPAKFERHDDDWGYLIISDAKNHYEFAWSLAGQSSGRVAPESNRIYTFTIVEEPFRDDLPIPKIVKVERDGKTIYDREVCEVHHTKMKLKKVPIVYGLTGPAPGEPHGNVEYHLFPNRNEFYLGGCSIDDHSPKTEKVYVCGECRKAYEKWKAEHPKAQ